MPTYDYICRECGHEEEIFQSMIDQPLIDCPSCNKPAFKRRIGAGAGLVFKGSGFYQTDYKNSGTTNGSGKTVSKESSSSSTEGTSASTGSDSSSTASTTSNSTE